MSNCSDFLIKKEDHTIGNLVAEHLKHHPHVLMAGYKSEETTTQALSSFEAAAES